MKLTEHNRNSICRSIMNDVPQPEYYEVMLRALVDAAVDLLPDEVKKLWYDPELRSFVNTASIYCDSIGYVKGVPWSDDSITFDDFGPAAPALMDKVRELEDIKVECEAAERRVRAALKGCSTVNTLRKRYPEFKKYIDMEFGKGSNSENPPAETNLITDLMKLGWPK